MGRDQLTSAAFEVPVSPPPRAKTGRVCNPCAVGDCGRCVRAGCYHPHGGDVRKHGCTASSEGVEHGAPKPGGGR